MANRRIERLNEQFKREITDVLLHDVRDPRVGRVTITDVRATADLDRARVYVASMGTADEKREAMEGLRAASTYIRRELSRRLQIRRVPELDFEWDATLEHAQRIEQLLREVRTPPSNETGDRENGEDDAD
ncbi:MAG: 30S ribosome-binding factor RbfA [Longimicrobiales bacterium]